MQAEYINLYNEFDKAKVEHDAAKAAVLAEMEQATQEMRLAFNNQMPSWSRYERALSVFRAAEGAMNQFLTANPSVLALILPKELPNTDS